MTASLATALREDTLRVVWPSWQGAGTASVEAFAPEFPLYRARRGYALGTSVLEAILPPHHGPTVRVPVPMGDAGLDERDGVEAKAAVLDQLDAAGSLIAGERWDRIVTLGGDCGVSIAPFAALADRYGDALAVVWIDAHPDVGTPASEYPGHHAMAVGVLTGHGDPDVGRLLPATVTPDRVALAGLHSWTEDDFPNAQEWGIATFAPGDLRSDSGVLLDWLRSTGCTAVAVHVDVDVVDSDEVVLGLGVEPGGLGVADVRRVVADLATVADVVGLTIAEYLPRQVMHLATLLDGLPLLGPQRVRA